jgi:hypothetical protein
VVVVRRRVVSCEVVIVRYIVLYLHICGVWLEDVFSVTRHQLHAMIHQEKKVCRPHGYPMVNHEIVLLKWP